jgi:hypothetical protein
MTSELLEHFERAIRLRNPRLADSLQPGLPEDDIRKMLDAATVEGEIDPIVSFFAWRNGSRLAPNVLLAGASPFPHCIYVFADLKTMIEHFSEFREGFVYHPKALEVDQRYFPLFWDNSTGYLAVDLKSSKGRMVLLDPESEDLAHEAYGSFEEFLKDAIRANKENDGLAGFRTISISPN